MGKQIVGDSLVPLFPCKMYRGLPEGRQGVDVRAFFNEGHHAIETAVARHRMQRRLPLEDNCRVGAGIEKQFDEFRLAGLGCRQERRPPFGGDIGVGSAGDQHLRGFEMGSVDGVIERCGDAVAGIDIGT